MLNRVNTYLRRIPYWRSWFPRNQDVSSSRGLCCLSIDTHDFSFTCTAPSADQIELDICKTIPVMKSTDLQMVLSDTVKKFHLDDMSCTWVLQPKHYQLLQIEDLPVDPSEFQAAIRWKIKSLISFPIEDAVIDSFPMPIQKTYNPQKMLMIVVSRASYLLSLSEKIQESGLRLKIIDIPELALKNVTSKFENDEMSTAFIWLQKKRGELIITNKKQLYLSRQFDFDFDTIKPNPADIEYNLQSLTLEIQRSFDYFQSQWRLHAPTRVLLASSKLPGVDITEILSNYLAIPVKMLNIDDIIVNKSNAGIEQQYKLLPLIGSALREETSNHAAAN